MKSNPSSDAILTGDSVETDTVGGCMAMARALEIAISDGRLAIDLSAHDWQQAKRELTGEAE